MRVIVRSILITGLLSLPVATAPEPERPETVEEQASPSAEASGAGLESFIPSEKLPADSAISFPVDI